MIFFANTLISLFRITSLCWNSLLSLWKAVRGSKWNPLRLRVDSVNLDSREQLVATLLFSLILFLVPTFLVYFVVFRVLYYVTSCIYYVLDKLAGSIMVYKLGIDYIMSNIRV